MKFFKSPFSSRNIIFGIGLTILGTLLTPFIKRRGGTISIKRRGEPLMSGNRFTGAREKMTGMINKFKEREPGENEPVTRAEFEQLKGEIRKEREQLQEMISLLNNIKNQDNNLQ